MAVYCPGTNGVHTTAVFANSMPATTDTTLMCWLNLSAATPATYRQIVVIGGASFGPSTYSDGVTIDFGTTSNDYNGQVLVPGIWYHIAMTVRNTSASNHYIRGYVNGALQVDATDTLTFGAYTQTTVGNWAAGAPYPYPLNGSIRDYRVWFNRILTQAEVSAEMRSSLPLNFSGLAVWAPFDDNLTQDKSGNNNIFTTTGSGVSLVAGPLQKFGIHDKFF